MTECPHCRQHQVECEDIPREQEERGIRACPKCKRSFAVWWTIERGLGVTADEPAEMWIGISTDEAHRQKPSKERFVRNRFPLLEAGLNREECQSYLVDRLGAKAPKSSCIGCPFHDDAYWLRMRKESPDEFAEAVEFDARMRVSDDMRGERFLHRSMIPLGQIKEFLHENQSRMFFDEFGNECEGMCGL